MTKDLIKVYTNKNNILSFEWMIIDKCQNKCSYCSSVDFNKNTLKNYDLYKIALTKLKTLKEPFKIDIVGGEPLLHKKIHKVVDELTQLNYCQSIDICSNMRKNEIDYLNLNQQKLKITASFHIEYSKGFIEKVISLHKKGLNIEVNMNLYPEKKYWSIIIDNVNFLKENNIPCGFNMLNPTSQYEPNYTDEFFDFFHDIFNQDKPYINHVFLQNGQKIIKKYSETDLFKYNISYKGMKCTPLQFQINPDGVIFNDCTNKIVKGFDLKNIKEEVKCPLNLCHNQIKYSYEKTI